VQGCVDGYRIAYPDQSIVLDATGGETLVSGAPELIAQMLDKLVANAVEFAAPGSPIAVRLARRDAASGAQVELSVENEGPALPAAMQGRLFDSMVSVREKQAGDEPHLGLGLYIVRLIAEFHGGTVRADNRSDASGVVVTVTLPLASPVER